MVGFKLGRIWYPDCIATFNIKKKVYTKNLPAASALAVHFFMISSRSKFHLELDKTPGMRNFGLEVSVICYNVHVTLCMTLCENPIKMLPKSEGRARKDGDQGKCNFFLAGTALVHTTEASTRGWEVGAS